MLHELTCEVCNQTFNNIRRTKKTCSDECQRTKMRKKSGVYSKNLPSNFLGRLHEYKVMLELALKGYDVFPAAFPQSHYDILAFERSTGIIKKVEVKTGYMRENGQVTIPQHRHNEWDIMAVVIQSEQKIVYFNNKKQIIFNEKDSS